MEVVDWSSAVAGRCCEGSWPVVLKWKVRHTGTVGSATSARAATEGGTVAVYVISQGGAGRRTSEERGGERVGEGSSESERLSMCRAVSV